MNGTCDERFAAVGELLDRRLRDGDETGASVCVVQDGEVVVDLWGGSAAAGVPWTRDTLVNTYSLTKTMVALVALLLVERGELDPGAPVARYWPEFAAAGKRDVLVRHVLGHTSGVSGWQQTVTLEELYDTERAAGLLAAQQPWWPPGEGSGYQAVCHGHLVGEIVRRITGTTPGALLRAEFPDADYWLGAPPEIDDRVATLVPPPSSGVDTAALDPIASRTLTNPVIPPAVTTTRPFLAAELGGLNGQGNARSVALLQSHVSHRRTSSVDRIFEVQSDGVDRVLGAPVRFGLGYALAEPRICWWSGLGGSVVVNDLDRRLTFAYVMNRMEPELIGAANTRAFAGTLRSCLR